MQVQKIACVNAAGFVMSFGIETSNDDRFEEIVANLDSGNYPIDQTRTIDLSTTQVPEGFWVKPQVRAVWGDTNLGNRWVQYAKNGETATFNVSGTTLNYSVNLIGA